MILGLFALPFAAPFAVAQKRDEGLSPKAEQQVRTLLSSSAAALRLQIASAASAAASNAVATAVPAALSTAITSAVPAAVSSAIASAVPPAVSSQVADAVPKALQQESDNEPGCGWRSSTRPHHKYASCFYGGGFLVGMSLTLATNDDGHVGQTAHQLTSLIVPTVGFRHVVSDDVSLDIGLLSSLSTISSHISTDLSANNSQQLDMACAVNASSFVKNLPCEGNATLQPYLALYAGASLIQGSNFSAVTLGPMIGFGHTPQEPTARTFIGLMVGFGSAYATFAGFGELGEDSGTAAPSTSAAPSASAGGGSK